MSTQPSINHYQIRVKGHLHLRWSEWFDDLAITHEPNGETTLAGPVADQAALYGLISKARDLGLTLIAVGPSNPEISARTEGCRSPPDLPTDVSASPRTPGHCRLPTGEAEPTQPDALGGV